MKKLFHSSLVLILFTFAIQIFNLSCSEEVEAQPSGSTVVKNLDVIIFRTGNDSNDIFWKTNYDGVSPVKVTIQSLPWNENDGGIDWGGVKASPDGTKLFLPVYFSSGYEIYSCNIDGTGIKKVSSGGLIDVL